MFWVKTSNGVVELHEAIGSTMGCYSWKRTLPCDQRVLFCANACELLEKCCSISLYDIWMLNSLSAIIGILYTTVKGYLILQCKSHLDDISLQGLDLAKNFCCARFIIAHTLMCLKVPSPRTVLVLTWIPLTHNWKCFYLHWNVFVSLLELVLGRPKYIYL